MSVCLRFLAKPFTMRQFKDLKCIHMWGCEGVCSVWVYLSCLLVAWVTVWPYHGPGREWQFDHTMDQDSLREWQFDHTMDQDSLRVYSLCLQICICTYRWLVRCQCFCFTLCCYVLMHFCCTKLYISVAYAVMWCLSFCLSHSCIMWKWVIIFSNFFHHSVFPYQML